MNHKVRLVPTANAVLISLVLASCGGASGTSTPVDEGSMTQAPQTEVTPGSTQQPIANDPSTSGTNSEITDGTNNGDSSLTIPSAQAPQVDSVGQVTWPYAPIVSSVELELMPFVEMPLATSGKPGRWNAMQYTGDRLFVSNEHDGRIYEISGRKVTFWFDVADAIRNATGRALNIDNPWHGGVRGFAFHPNFNNNGKFYVSMMQDRPSIPSEFNYLSDASNVAADSVLVEWTANPGTFEVDANSYREVFRVGIPEYDHPIKQIAFNPYALIGEADFGLLYIAHGDGSLEGSTAATGEANDALGKILSY